MPAETDLPVFVQKGGKAAVNIVITGANRGLGYELAKKFVEQGHKVAAGYFPGVPFDMLESLSEKHGSSILLIPLDVTKEEDIAAAAAILRNMHYPIDAVISNAGILCDHDRVNDVLDMLADDLRSSLEVNLIGPALIIRYFYPLMKKSLESSFITITSEGGSIKNSGSNFPAYSISKAAANKLVAAFNAAVTDIRIFAMHPGRMNTVMGKTTAQIEAWESANGIFNIVTGITKVPKEAGWFIDYKGNPMIL